MATNQLADPKLVTHALSIVAAGNSFRAAAKATGLAPETVRRYFLRQLGPEAAERDNALREAMQRVGAQALALCADGIALMATELPDLSPGDRRGAVLVASKVLERMGTHSGGSIDAGSRIVAALNRLESRVTLTVDVQPDPDAEAPEPLKASPPAILARLMDRRDDDASSERE